MNEEFPISNQQTEWCLGKTELFLFMQVGGFVLPLLVFGGISLLLTPLLLVNAHPTGVY